MAASSLLSAAEAAAIELPSAATTSPAGIVSRTVLQAPEFRVVLFAFDAGQELTTHTNRRRALLQVTSGSAEVWFNGGWHLLEAGALLHLPPEHPHAVRASQGACTLLLTLGAEPAA